MEYALVKDGVVYVTAEQPEVLSSFVYAQDGESVSFPAVIANGDTIAGYTVYHVVDITTAIPNRHVSTGYYDYAVAGTTVTKSQVVVPLIDDIDHERQLAKQRAERTRDAMCTANVVVNGSTWQADERSQSLLGQAISLAVAGGTLPQVWRDADNNNVAITAVGDLIAIANAIASQTQQAYLTCWATKAAIDAATTVDELYVIAPI